MDSNSPLDHAVFQLSPRRSRCDLFISGNGKTEKLASGLLNSFITHLKVAEQQAAQGGKSIKLEVQRSTNGDSWFNKGTLERFVRFVSTPEVLESANAYDAEMSQLEGARRIYSQGAGDPLAGTLGDVDTSTTATVDTTKMELLRTIDLRLTTLEQDLATACARAFSAGFSIENVSELLLFAEYFDADHLNEACKKFILLSQRHPELIGKQQQSKAMESSANGNIRSSSSLDTDMSIDEPELVHGGGGKPPDGDGLQLHNPNVSKPSHFNTTPLSGTSQQAKLIKQRLEGAMLEQPVPPASSANVPAQSGGASFRRLSVQDRINLFEGKQKEQSASSRNISTAGVINKVLAGKGEQQRLPSDVSEKSVLRRWSGASDMSIDPSSSSSKSFNDQKESGSDVGTPTSANLQLQSMSKTEEAEVSGFEDTATSQCWLDLEKSTTDTSSYSLLLSQSQFRASPSTGDCTDDEDIKFSLNKGKQFLERGQDACYLSASMSRMKYCGSGDQDASMVHQKGFLGTSSNAGLKDYAVCHIQLKAEDQVQIEDQKTLLDISQPVLCVTKQVRSRDQESLQTETREVPSRATSAGIKDQPKVVNQFWTFEKRVNPLVKPKGPSDSPVQFGNSSVLSSENNLLAYQSEGKTSPSRVEEEGGGNAAASHATFGSSLVKTKEDTDHQGINWHQAVNPERCVDEIADTKINCMPAVPLRKAKEMLEMVEPPSAHLAGQLQVARPSKGNQELNDELRMKANELEKHFAEHKLRTLSEQTASSRRNRPVNVQDKHVPMAVEKTLAVALPGQLPETNPLRETSNSEIDFDANFLLKMVSNEENDSSINQALGTLSPSDDSRGKFYYKYMQKRNAKLQEEWGIKGAQKEAKMKAMHDSLDCSQAEMNSIYSGSADRQCSRYRHRRVEKLRYFSNNPALRSENQQAVKSVQEEEDLEEVREQVDNGQDISFNDLFGDNASEITDLMELLSMKTLSSSTPWTEVKPSVKSIKSVPIKCRTQTENPLAESLPNFSDFIKENAKPFTDNNRVSTREKRKIFSRSKIIIEAANLVKEEKPQRSHSMRKRTARPSELKDLSSLNSDTADLTPLGVSKGPTNANFIDKVQRSREAKSLIRKEKVTGLGLGANIHKPKTCKVSKVKKNGLVFEGIVHREDSSSLVKDVLETEISLAKGDAKAVDFLILDCEKPRNNQGYNSSDIFGSENDVQRSLSQADYDTVPDSPIFSTSTRNEQESPGESPHSWDLHLHQSFSGVHEASEIHASIDSPVGSPASWNLHPLNQTMETDASRMRKKWGTAQMPMIVANASQQSCMDVTEGFKRILKFGRKSKGVESQVTNWVSALTASEGGDETIDGHDLAAQPENDLWKPKMEHALPHDRFTDGEIFPEQALSLRSSIPNPPANFKLRKDNLSGSSLKAPRSFFSLSSFRSKESKPR
ncbi:unnamed protein product [Musa acuminata subsp. burmannicoides]